MGRSLRKSFTASLFYLAVGIISGFLSAYIYVYLYVVAYKGRCVFLPIRGEEVLLEQPKDFVYQKDGSVARDLREKVKILCWVTTNVEYHKTRAEIIKYTWGKRCDHLIFISDFTDNDLNAINLNLESLENEPTTTSELEKTLKYLYVNYYNDYDWFMRASDTNYIIMENLRFLLLKYNPNDLYYAGLKYTKRNLPNGTVSDKAGYILSKGTLQHLAVIVLPYTHRIFDGPTELLDTEQRLGIFSEHYGIRIIDTRDYKGRERFYPADPRSFLPETSIEDPVEAFLWSVRYYHHYEENNKEDCCSETAISFYNIPLNKMVAFEYLIYFLNPYGIVYY